MLVNLSPLWTGAQPDQKQRLQTVFFPDGVDFNAEEFRTPVSGMIFNDLANESAEKTHLVTRAGLEPATYGSKVRNQRGEMRVSPLWIAGTVGWKPIETDAACYHLGSSKFCYHAPLPTERREVSGWDKAALK